MAKRIIRLTESDLMRIVKRVIKENTNVGLEAGKQFCDAFGVFNDREDLAFYAVSDLQNMNDFKVFNAYVTKLKGMDAKEFFNSKMSPFNPEYDRIVEHILKITNNQINWGENTTANKIYRGLGKGLDQYNLKMQKAKKGDPGSKTI